MAKGKAKGGTAVDLTVQCPALTAGSARETIVRLVGADREYRVVAVGPDRFEFARSVRPKWAVITGSVTAVTGVGLFLFLIRATETCSAVLEENYAGVRVRLTGSLRCDLLDSLRAALGEKPAAMVAVPRAVPVTVVDLTPSSLPRLIESAPVASPSLPSVGAGETRRVACA